MWLTSSSIGRKFVMAITGIALVLFVTFHVLMNTVAIAWPTAYNVICEFLGANWYALIASAGLALLFIIHIIYACWLTVQNRKARGNDRYLVTSRPPQVEWSSKNMLVLGLVILAFLVVHLIQFWYKMQWQEIVGHMWSTNGVPFAPEFGTLFIQAAFGEFWTIIVYCVGFIALWFHMTHGFWSMFHSVGWDNNHWIERLKCIGYWWTTIVVALFVAQAIVFTVLASKDHYLTDPKLQEQYAHYWEEESEAILMEMQGEVNQAGLNRQPRDQYEYMQLQQAYGQLMERLAPQYIGKIDAIQAAHQALFPNAQNVMSVMRLEGLGEELRGILNNPADQGAPEPGPEPFEPEEEAQADEIPVLQ
ncbi:MAG: succinate dehydrogenase cytochrome b subunit [Bacteroidales bacterium]|nr:succinate dehydrogenase cytochrome b subunit [Bacteroidales bacterium]